MQLLEKHVLKSYILSVIFCVILLMVVGVIGDMLSFLEDIFKENISLYSVLSFYAYLSPFAFVHMIPFACLLAGVYVFNSLSRTHEITAVIASGLSLWKLLKPVLMATFLISLAVFIVNDKVVPVAMERADSIRREELETGYRAEKRRAGINDLTVYGRGGHIIFARTFNVRDNELLDVIIHEEDEEHRVVKKVSARKVVWQGSDGWVGKDVLVFSEGFSGRPGADPEFYETRKIDILENPRQLERVRSDPRFMSYVQLRDYLRMLRSGARDSLVRLTVDLNYKLSFPFTALITVLIGVPFSIDAGRANPLIGMARGIIAGLAYLPVVAVSLALGKGGYMDPALSAWLAMILFAITGVHYVNKKS